MLNMLRKFDVDDLHFLLKLLLLNNLQTRRYDLMRTPFVYTDTLTPPHR